MANRPVRYDANLPRNLTFRKRDKLYSWRNPITGQEVSLGRVARKDAVAQAIEANNYIDQNYLPSTLLEKIKDVPTFTVSAPVKAPFSCPKSSDSSKAPGIAPQFTRMNGPRRRSLA